MTDNFDRYIYEAIVRGKSETIDATYSIVKHENPRAESSSILDSPQHLRELEPMYAIRPLYLALISLLSHAVPIQSAINLISAASLFGIGFVVLLWTGEPLLTALLIAPYPILLLGRFGTPDALAALLVLSALWLLDRHISVALTLLFISIGVRTDNVLLLLFVLAWLAWEKKLSLPVAGVLALLGAGFVAAINQWTGNYGWIVLFRFSFVGGRYPAQVPYTLSIREYVQALITGAVIILTRVSLWVLIGIIAWKRRPEPLLIVVACAAAAHFLLYPSPEDRYLVWAYVVAAVALIRSFDKPRISTLSS